MKKFNKLLLSAVIALSAATMLSSCDVKEGFGGFVDTVKDTVYGWIGIETEEEPENPEEPETPAEKKVRVTFEENGGSTVVDTEYVVGKAYALPTITKKGYTFLGWYKDINDETSKIESGSSWTIETDVTLTAKWQANTYTLTLKYEDGLTADKVESIEYGKADCSIPNPQRTGYNFAGWVKEDGSAFEKSGEWAWTYEDDLVLKATWSTNLVFVFGNGTASKEIVGPTEGASWDWTNETDLISPTKSGYTFSGWYLEVEDETTKIELSGSSWTYGTVSIYAKWTAKSYELKFDAGVAGTGVAVPENKSVTYGGQYNATSWDNIMPTANGLRFTGWLIQETNTTLGASAMQGTWEILDTNGDGEFTLVAQWVKVYAISYIDTVGGTVVPGDEYVTYYEEGYSSVVRLPMLEDTDGNYSFNGWKVNGKVYKTLDADFFANFDGDSVVLEASWSSNWTKNY